MKITWVIEPELWPGHSDQMRDATEAMGHDLFLTDVSLERPLPKIEGAVVVHGSFQLARKVWKETNWSPGVICTIDNYVWSSYAPNIPKEFLLNNSWTMDTTSNLVKMAESKSMGDCFVRPDSGAKPFGGTPFFGDRLLWPAMTRMFLRDGGDIPVVVSPLKTLMDEYRMVVVGDKVVSRSKYMSDGDIEISPGAPEEALEMVESAISSWRPDRAFVVDVAETVDGYRIVEYNAFSTADWYGCDVHQIVSEMDGMLGNS